MYLASPKNIHDKVDQSHASHLSLTPRLSMKWIKVTQHLQLWPLNSEPVKQAPTVPPHTTTNVLLPCLPFRTTSVVRPPLDPQHVGGL